MFSMAAMGVAAVIENARREAEVAKGMKISARVLVDSAVFLGWCG